ncbi:MAG: flavin reductase family protein [Planctomycetota bacterium]|jgi:flavin reductase (DIM6/NTAB) family NADH-FMN oxidoreductase RutF|nr:flavin reductase family protein [Planctomycetota bacterium]
MTIPNSKITDLPAVATLFKELNQAIWIVTTSTADHQSGLTATWVHQASIDSKNPSVLIGLAPNHFTCELLLQSGFSIIHMLKTHQSQVAYHFAQPSSRYLNKFNSVPHKKIEVTPDNLDGNRIWIPYLTDCHSAILVQTVKHFNAGDRIYFLCQIIQLIDSSETPFLRESEFFTNCTPTQIQQLKSDLKADVTLQRPLLNDWLKTQRNQ